MRRSGSAGLLLRAKSLGGPPADPRQHVVEVYVRYLRPKAREAANRRPDPHLRGPGYCPLVSASLPAAPMTMTLAPVSPWPVQRDWRRLDWACPVLGMSALSVSSLAPTRKQATTPAQRAPVFLPIEAQWCFRKPEARPLYPLEVPRTRQFAWELMQRPALGRAAGHVCFAFETAGAAELSGCTAPVVRSN